MPDLVLRCIMNMLPIQDRCNLARAHDKFDDLLSEKVYWRSLILDDDNACVNAVCHYIFEHSTSVQEVLIDNVTSPESSFTTLWTDVLLAAFTNVRKITVVHSTFLTSALFVSRTPFLTELRLQSCPNLSAFTLLQVFLCTPPPLLKVLDLTGAPGLNERTAVQLVTACKSLEYLDLSGSWGPLLCMTCVHKVIRECPKLTWCDVCPYIPQSPVWVHFLAAHGTVDNRRISFGPYIVRIVEVNRDVDW